MSDFDDDLADELLELAGASERKERRRSKSKGSSKKRKLGSRASDSERELESEEDDGGMDDDDGEGDDNDNDEGGAERYTYEDIYIDAEDKERLLSLPETKREEILAEREEQKRKLNERRNLEQLVKQHKGGMDDGSVAQAAKRQHTARGATKEKSRKLDELKAKRRAQDESRKRAKLSPRAHRDRSASPQDMDISSDESEDGIITREEQQEERERRLLGISSSSKKDEESEDNTPATLEDFNGARLTRDMVSKSCMNPWFQEYVTNSWVRYLIGNEGGEPVYRMCEIAKLSDDLVKPYKVNERTINQAVDLKHGKSTKQFNMDRISNAPFTQREWSRLVAVCRDERVALPTKGDLVRKREQMRKLEARPLTNDDITAMLKRKKELQKSVNPSELKIERSKLNQSRSLALKRHDEDEVAQLDKQLAAVQAKLDALAGDVVEDSRDEVLRKVNERNRKANIEAVRKAELAELERKRREKEMIAKGVAPAARVDPSARLKTVPRMFNSATPTTRPGTPAAAASQGSTPVPSVPTKPGAVSSQIAFEQKLLDTIEIDLGDF